MHKIYASSYDIRRFPSLLFIVIEILVSFFFMRVLRYEAATDYLFVACRVSAPDADVYFAPSSFPSLILYVTTPILLRHTDRNKKICFYQIC